MLRMKYIILDIMFYYILPSLAAVAKFQLLLKLVAFFITVSWRMSETVSWHH